MTTQKIGYGRVSTQDQHLDDQQEKLSAYGVDELHVEKFTGTKASRPEWDLVKGKLREGDTLVVTKLDRLGRSTRDLLEIAAFLEEKGVDLVATEQPGINTTTAEGRLFFTMIAAFAEFEHAMMRSRTMDGLAAARARGRKGGRKPALTERQVADIRRRVNEERQPITDVAADYKVSRPTIYRALGLTKSGLDLAFG